MTKRNPIMEFWNGLEFWDKVTVSGFLATILSLFLSWALANSGIETDQGKIVGVASIAALVLLYIKMEEKTRRFSVFGLSILNVILSFYVYFKIKSFGSENEFAAAFVGAVIGNGLYLSMLGSLAAAIGAYNMVKPFIQKR